MRAGVHMNCIHEFPSVVGPARYECEFALMFGDDWTPAHLTGGKYFGERVHKNVLATLHDHLSSWKIDLDVADGGEGPAGP